MVQDWTWQRVVSTNWCVVAVASGGRLTSRHGAKDAAFQPDGGGHRPEDQQVRASAQLGNLRLTSAVSGDNFRLGCLWFSQEPGNFKTLAVFTSTRKFQSDLGCLHLKSGTFGRPRQLLPGNSVTCLHSLSHLTLELWRKNCLCCHWKVSALCMWLGFAQVCNICHCQRTNSIYFVTVHFG